MFAVADVIISYNISFDIEMLQGELARIERAPLDLTSKKIVDAFRLWQQCEPRSLQHAHRRFVGDEFAAAHSASADVKRRPGRRCSKDMLSHFKLADQDWHQIASVCDPMPGRASWVGPSRHLRWEGESIVVGFGKYAGIALHELAAGLRPEFLAVGDAERLPELRRRDLQERARAPPRKSWRVGPGERFGQPAPTAQPPFAQK